MFRSKFVFNRIILIELDLDHTFYPNLHTALDFVCLVGVEDEM